VEQTVQNYVQDLAKVTIRLVYSMFRDTSVEKYIRKFWWCRRQETKTFAAELHHHFSRMIKLRLHYVADLLTDIENKVIDQLIPIQS